MLCAALTPAVLEDIFSSDLSLVDAVEVRLDYLNNPEQSSELSYSRFQVPAIATCRRRERGGRFKGTVDEERRILDNAIRNGAAFIDVDYRDALLIPGSRTIGSYHNFDETPSDVRLHLQRACNNPAVDIAKVATMVNTWADNRRLLALLDERWSKPVIVIGMGEMGQITRVIGASRGSYLTYTAAPQPSSVPSAPSQLTAKELLEDYRHRRIRRSTKLFGVVGNPVSHSLGYIRHNRSFEDAGVDSAYLKCLVKDVADFIENASPIGFHGFSVTMPHKLAVMPYLSDITPTAREAGAVNTVWRSGDAWIGDNTDVYGVRAALASANFDPVGKHVVILGAGGAAKAAAAALKEAATVVMLHRTEFENAKNLPCDLLINATPVGMAHIDASPIEGEIPGSTVLDMVYTPPTTRLLKLAAEQGKTVISGSVMFKAQGDRQFEIWSAL